MTELKDCRYAAKALTYVCLLIPKSKAGCAYAPVLILESSSIMLDMLFRQQDLWKVGIVASVPEQ